MIRIIKSITPKYLQFISDAHLEHLKSPTTKSKTGATPTLMHGGKIYNLDTINQKISGSNKTTS